MVTKDLCEAGQSARVSFAARHVGAGEIDGPVAVSAGELVDLAYERRRLHEPQAETLGDRGVAPSQHAISRDQPRRARVTPSPSRSSLLPQPRVSCLDPVADLVRALTQIPDHATD